MMFRTHMAICFLAAFAFVNVISVAHPILFVLIAMFVGSVPDIDTRHSKIAQTFPFISYILSFFIIHRGITHSLLIPLGAYLLFDALNVRWIGLAFVIGYAAHLAADALTKEGVNLLSPFPKLQIMGFIRTGGILESVIFYAVIVINLLVVINVFL